MNKLTINYDDYLQSEIISNEIDKSYNSLFHSCKNISYRKSLLFCSSESKSLPKDLNNFPLHIDVIEFFTNTELDIKKQLNLYHTVFGSYPILIDFHQNRHLRLSTIKLLNNILKKENINSLLRPLKQINGSKSLLFNILLLTITTTIQFFYNTFLHVNFEKGVVLTNIHKTENTSSIIRLINFFKIKNLIIPMHPHIYNDSAPCNSLILKYLEDFEN